MGGMDGPESSANRKLPRKAIKFHYSVIRQVSATFPRVHDSVSSSPSGKQMAWLDQLLPVFDSGLVRGRGVCCGGGKVWEGWPGCQIGTEGLIFRKEWTLQWISHCGQNLYFFKSYFRLVMSPSRPPPSPVQGSCEWLKLLNCFR